MTETEGASAAHRLTMSLIDEAMQVGPRFGFEVSKFLADLHLISWPNRVDLLMVGMVRRRPETFLACATVWCGLCLPFYMEPHYRDPYHIGDFIDVAADAAGPRQIARLAQMLLDAIEVTSRAHERPVLLQRLRTAAVKHGLNSAKLDAAVERWSSEAPEPRHSYTPSRYDSEATLEELERAFEADGDELNYNAPYRFAALAESAPLHLVQRIDDLRRLECQVVLILNEKQLGGRTPAWSTYHEKVVDIQLALQPMPADAIDAVINMAAVGRREAIRDAWLHANCRNIRVAQRVVRADRTIFRDRDARDIGGLVADTVFLTIAEARAFHEDADSVEVLSVLTGGARSADPEVRQRLDAIRASNSINFSIYRSFQEAVIEFLKTGHIDESRWDQCINEAEQDVVAGSERQKLHNWFEAALWDPTLSDEAAKRTAQELLPEVWRLDPRNAQVFIYALKEIGAGDLVDPFVAAWIDGINRHRVLYSKDLTLPPIEPVDPRILEGLDQLASLLYPRPPIIEALRRQVGRRDYREIDVAAINEAAADEWANLLLSAESKEPFALLHDLHRLGGIETQQGRTVMRVALRTICEQQPESKLAHVILRSGILPPGSLVDGPQGQPAHLANGEVGGTAI